MNDKHKHFVHFLEKWVIIFIILFVVIQIGGGIIIHIITPEDEKSSLEEYDKEYMGHWYDGTFFIEMTVKENFNNYEEYELMNKELNKDSIKEFCYISGTIFSIIGIILLLFSAYKERKKELLKGNTPIIIGLSGICLLMYKIFEEIDLYREIIYFRKYSKGFLATCNYYFQIHLFIIPLLLILLGLLFRQKQMKIRKKSTTNNEKIIKVVSLMFLSLGIGFILYRFGIRMYELFMVIMNKNINIKIPYYYIMLELPNSYSNSSYYLKLTIIRFIKDLPIFISSIICIVLFFKIIMSSLDVKTVSKENNNRYKIIFILLIISSLIFNVLGLYEVKLFHDGFVYPFNEATYTIALRSLTDPLLYGFFIYLFKYYTELVYKDK